MGPILLITFWILAQSPTAAQSDNGTIEGMVIRADALSPISGAEILATREGRGSPQTLSVVADQNGRFLIRDVPPGRYRVSSRHIGFFATAQSYATITVRRREQIRDVELSLLPPHGRIHGTVVRPDGLPVAGVSVELANLTYWSGQRQLHKSGHETNTDARGEYRFEVPPGNYYVRTAASALFARTYSPDTTDAVKAAAIQVREDSDTTADIHLSQAPFKISGRVVDPHSGPGDREVSIFLANRGATIRDDGLPLTELPCCGGPEPVAVLRDLTRPFEIRGVSPGRYDLHVLMIVRGPVANPLGYYVGRAAVEVKDSDVPGVEIVPGSLLQVQGQIVSSGEPIKKINQASVHLTALDSNPFGGSATAVDKSGRFTAYLREGSYQLSFDLPSPDAYIADVLQGGKSILNSGLVVTAASTDPVRVIVNPKGAVIRGVVQNGPEAVIYLHPTTSRINSRGARASKAGDFTLSGVAPGDYMIFAFHRNRRPEVQDPDFLTTYGSQGTPISIRDGTTETVTLPFSLR